MVSQAKAIGKMCHQLKSICIGSHVKFTQNDVPISINISYGYLGRELAKQVIEIEEGKLLVDMPIIYSQKSTISVNRSALLKVAPELLDQLPQDTVYSH